MAVRKKQPPDLDRLRKLVSYCAESGILTWALSRRRCAKGAIAGCRRGNGHIYVRIDGEDYCAARIAWFLTTGVWPEEIDHKSCDASDNRWGNLRECTHAQNICNRRMSKANKCGFKGVYEHQGKWRARMRFQGKLLKDGLFSSAEEAHAAYTIWVHEFHGDFARAQ